MVEAEIVPQDGYLGTGNRGRKEGSGDRGGRGGGVAEREGMEGGGERRRYTR